MLFYILFFGNCVYKDLFITYIASEIVKFLGISMTWFDIGTHNIENAVQLSQSRNQEEITCFKEHQRSSCLIRSLLQFIINYITYKRT